MLIYRTQARQMDRAPLLARLHAETARAANAVSHEQATEWLIEFGELEAGLMDALCPEADADSHTARLLRRLALHFGAVFIAAWEQRTTAAAGAEINYLLNELLQTPLPARVSISVPEGYAHYGLYPETYATAARQFQREMEPAHVVCIGLRSIGASLSAVVGAALQQGGVRVQAYTVRPRGHPFARRLQLNAQLAQAWRAQTDAYFLLVDEGPGLSGSSLCGAAQQLTELGVSDERIIFFPSWQPDAAQFVNENARERWRRQRKYTSEFAQDWCGTESVDLSGGQWRALFYQSENDSPAVQPQHERRKYLAQGVWWKFAGLGKYGKAKLPRAETLAAAGFAPRVLDLRNGFLALEFSNGQPLTRAAVNAALLTTLARYLAFVKTSFPVSGAPGADLYEMTRHNVAEGLGEQWAERLARSGFAEHVFADAALCAIDGRMLPHEWLRVGAGYLKTDGLDHHDDHFYPGCQDSAWDVAGCCLEFALDQQQAAYLIAQYRKFANDDGIAARLPFYRIAYAAFRLGYATLAAQTLHGAPDGAKFAALRDEYAATLRRDINQILPRSHTKQHEEKGLLPSQQAGGKGNLPLVPDSRFLAPEQRKRLVFNSQEAGIGKQESG